MEIKPVIDDFVARGGSDLYLTVGAAPTMRLNGKIEALTEKALKAEDIEGIIMSLLSRGALDEFSRNYEYNTAIRWGAKARLRINLFRQQLNAGIVIRRIVTELPTIESLNLPEVYATLAMERRGLVLVVGPTGSGKSTSLAAMINHRNMNDSGHIITIEDPVEFMHEHKQCIITQRDIGVDTHSLEIALKNALRQQPDVIVIGEIRDRNTMEQALTFAETGHLVLATLHASNSSQAIERILTFFPEPQYRQVLMSIAVNMRAVLSQRLMNSQRNKRLLACEIMLNQGAVRTLITEGKITELRQQIENSQDVGMQSFEQSLLDLYMSGAISQETAMMESDTPATMRMLLKQAEMKRYTGNLRGTLPPAIPDITPQARPAE